MHARDALTINVTSLEQPPNFQQGVAHALQQQRITQRGHLDGSKAGAPEA